MERLVDIPSTWEPCSKRGNLTPESVISTLDGEARMPFKIHETSLEWSSKLSQQLKITCYYVTLFTQKLMKHRVVR